MKPEIITEYKKMFANMIHAENLRFGWVSGSDCQFFIQAGETRLTWDKRTNTIVIPELDKEQKERKRRPPPNGYINPKFLVETLKTFDSSTTLYVPSSPEDEFQASTAYEGEVLPYELVADIELLLCAAKESISQYSIQSRVCK